MLKYFLISFLYKLNGNLEEKINLFDGVRYWDIMKRRVC